MNANTSGDSSIARHLAYYAELRAALGLLATQEAGIFSSQDGPWWATLCSAPRTCPQAIW
jgi:hypothetical protein